MIDNFFTQQFNSINSWATKTPVPKIVDTFTYDLYESENPFRIEHKNNIKNKYLKITLDSAQTLGAEVYSAYTNPFYLTHKMVNIPTNLQTIIEAYKKSSTNLQ